MSRASCPLCETNCRQARRPPRVESAAHSGNRAAVVNVVVASLRQDQQCGRHAVAGADAARQLPRTDRRARCGHPWPERAAAVRLAGRPRGHQRAAGGACLRHRGDDRARGAAPSGRRLAAAAHGACRRGHRASRAVLGGLPDRGGRATARRGARTGPRAVRDRLRRHHRDGRRRGGAVRWGADRLHRDRGRPSRADPHPGSRACGGAARRHHRQPRRGGRAAASGWHRAACRRASRGAGARDRPSAAGRLGDRHRRRRRACRPHRGGGPVVGAIRRGRGSASHLPRGVGPARPAARHAHPPRSGRGVAADDVHAGFRDRRRAGGRRVRARGRRAARPLRHPRPRVGHGRGWTRIDAI
jgi:hypothetical protein